MRCFNFLTHFWIILILPSLLVAQPERLHTEETYFRLQKDEFLFSYDEVLSLLEEIENGDIETKYNPYQQDKINHFLASLALEGLMSEDEREIAFLTTEIATFLQQDSSIFHYVNSSNFIYENFPYHSTNTLLCKSWVHKKWDQTRKFAKKHKKAIIIGAAIVVGATLVVGIVALVSTASATSLAALPNHEGKDSQTLPLSSEPINTQEQVLEDTIKEELSVFKKEVMKSEFLNTRDQSFPIEENGRILGEVLAHRSLDTFKKNMYFNSDTSYESQTSGYLSDSWKQGHNLINQNFSIENQQIYSQNFNEINTQLYQARAERALELKYPYQAIKDFGKVIDLNPYHHETYLQRASTYLETGNIELSLKDYQLYSAIKPLSLDFLLDFCSGFMESFPGGIVNSGQHLASFAGQLLTQPIDTMQEVGEGLILLTKFMLSNEWGLIAQTLAPEIHDLVVNWDDYSIYERGKLAGHAVGKHGGDLGIPLVIGKAIPMGTFLCEELILINKTFKNAEKVYELEALAQTRNLSTLTLETSQILTQTCHDLEKFIEAGKALDRGGFTKAGRALAKHGNRQGTCFPRPFGNAEKINKYGQEILEEILSDPHKEFYYQNGKLKIYSSNGRGLQYKEDGSLIGFIEKQYE